MELEQESRLASDPAAAIPTVVEPCSVPGGRLGPRAWHKRLEQPLHALLAQLGMGGIGEHDPFMTCLFSLDLLAPERVGHRAPGGALSLFRGNR
jgi:hypothetical protein